MNPQTQIRNLKSEKTPFVLARLDVQHGQNFMAFIEYEVLSHDDFWLELKLHRMKIKTGSRNGTIINAEDLTTPNVKNPVWYRWSEIAPFEIRVEASH